MANTRRCGVGFGDFHLKYVEIKMGMAPKVSRRGLRLKGQRFERAIVGFFQALGIRAERVPNSGSSGGNFGADVQLFLPGIEGHVRVEAKCRADGFRLDHKWLEGADVLVKGANLDDALIVIRLKDLMRKQDG